MNRTSVFGRKLVYLFILIGMLVPLYLLGQPSAGRGDAGGRLSEMRREFNIAESDLGEISPASETMKLASLGLRGVAATLLWNKAHEYRVLHEWDRLKAALNNIALLQPHYDRVWEHQAHNLAYNVSVEFDDYRQRYEMVREGTEFLTRGVRQNRNAPRLIWYTGWFYGQKMGMSDEKRQFRRLFADDEVLHESLRQENIDVDSADALGPLSKPDNWLVGRLWLYHGYDMVDGGIKIRRQTPLNFYETGPKWRIKHAEAIESEGILDFRAGDAWKKASLDWESFGQRSVPTTSPFTIKLGELDELMRQRAERLEDFQELTGEAYQAEVDKLVEKLPEDLQKVLRKPESERTEDGKRAVESLGGYLVPDLEKVAKSSDESVRLRAVSLVGEIADLEARAKKTDNYRNQINYEYWETLAQAEQEDRTVLARAKIYAAEEANSKAELDKAIALYEEAFTIWAEIFDDYPILTIDDSAEDLYDSIRRYMIAIDSQTLPEDFPLTTFAEMMGQTGSIDSQRYQEVREQQRIKAEQRQQELAEEERKREEAAAKAEAAEQEKQEKSEPEKSEPEKSEPEKSAADEDPQPEASEQIPPDDGDQATDPKPESESAEPEDDVDSPPPTDDQPSPPAEAAAEQNE